MAVIGFVQCLILCPIFRDAQESWVDGDCIATAPRMLSYNMDLQL